MRNRLLIVTAVAAERDALGFGEVVGVGSAAAAAGTARLLASGEYRAVISAGIGGGFVGRVGIGGTVLGTESIAADLGADSPDGFLPLSELGFGTDRYPVDPALLEALRAVLPDAVAGPILTVSTVTGTAAGTAALAGRHPDAAAEAMEGFGVATAAAGAGVPFAEIRTVSNVAGLRDRSAWQVGTALGALAEVGRVLRKGALGRLER